MRANNIYYNYAITLDIHCVCCKFKHVLENKTADIKTAYYELDYSSIIVFFIPGQVWNYICKVSRINSVPVMYLVETWDHFVSLICIVYRRCDVTPKQDAHQAETSCSGVVRMWVRIPVFLDAHLEHPGYVRYKSSVLLILQVTSFIPYAGLIFNGGNCLRCPWSLPWCPFKSPNRNLQIPQRCPLPRKNRLAPLSTKYQACFWKTTSAIQWKLILLTLTPLGILARNLPESSIALLEIRPYLQIAPCIFVHIQPHLKRWKYQFPTVLNFSKKLSLGGFWWIGLMFWNNYINITTAYKINYFKGRYNWYNFYQIIKFTNNYVSTFFVESSSFV